MKKKLGRALLLGALILAPAFLGKAGFIPLPASGTPAPASPSTIVLVIRAVDGDTIELESHETVRYIGIDAPESVHPKSPVQCFGKVAASRNRELVEGKYVHLERDMSDRDRYGRLLRYVYLGEAMVNETLVTEGFARATTFPPDVKYKERFRAAEREARTGKKGLWATCPSNK